MTPQERMGWHHVPTRHTKVHAQDNPQGGRRGAKKGDHSQRKLPGIFEGDPSEAEHFIYKFATYFMAHDEKLVLASPVARAALTLSQVKGEEVDQWVDQQLQWLELQDQQDPKVGSTFIEAFFKQFVPKGRWQSIARIEMKWPHIDEYISNFEKAHVHNKQPLKGIDQAQRFIEGLAGSIKRAMTDKFQTYKKAKKQACHIVGIQKLLHQAYKKKNNVWTNAQGQPQKMLQPTIHKKPASHVPMHKEQRKLKKAWQVHWRATEEGKGTEAHLFMGNPHTSLNSPTLQSAMGEIQMNKPNPIIDTTTPSIDDLCTQMDSLTIKEREEVINCLCTAWGESCSQLVWSAWRKRNNTEGIYLSIQKSMQLHVFIHLTHKWDEAAALLDSGATENFIQESYAWQLKLPVKCLSHTWPVYNVDGTLNKNRHIHSYTDLEMQTGQWRTKLCFFLTDIGDQKLILGYPWFTAMQPNINWARGWINTEQLPLIIHAPKKKKVHIGKCSTTPTGRHNVKHPYTPANDSLYVAWVQIGGAGPSTSKKQMLASKLVEQAGLQKGNGEIPAKYQWHSHVFSKEVAHRFPESHIWDHAIELKPNALSTIPGKIYQLTQDEQKALLNFMTEQQAKGYIHPSKSPYATPFFFIKKKDSKLQPIQDYQCLNEWTIKNCYPLPLISKLIARVQNAKMFTKVDIRWGYNNIHIKEGDKCKAAFITNQGLFKPTVMFFRLMNSPAMFQSMMNAIFAPEIAKGWLIVYMDDILIAAQDDPKFHEECVHHILEKLCLHDLYLKPEKCVFEQQRMEFLGVVLENGTVQMDPAKLKGIADWPQPQHVTDVCAFLGFTGFYQYFMPNYSNIVWPLIQLTKKNTVFKWTEECKVTFKWLKTLMCSCPILQQPDYTKAFFLATDASAYGVGTILLQEGEINPCTQKPMLCLIAYYLATFTPTQRNYDIYEWEFLGVYMPLMKYRPHLAAMEIPVTILTDHANLLHWKLPQKVNQQVVWWFSDLQDFNLIFKHVPGKIHAAPDMLSWPPSIDKGEHDNEVVTLIPESLFIKTTITTSSAIQSQVLTAQETAWVEMEEWCNTQGARKLPEGYVKDNKWVVPSDEQLRCDTLSQYHDSPMAGHPGRDNTIALVMRHYWWPKMNAWIKQYIKGCMICQQNKICITKNKMPLYHIPGDLTKCPFNMVAMDLITHLPWSNGHDAILTIIDQGCSRAVAFLPCSTTITGEGIAKLYLQHIFPWFRIPTKMISDRDPCFTSHFTKALTTKLKIDCNISTTFHPQTDGLSKWKNQWVEQYLQMYMTAWQDNWDEWLPLTSFVHNQWLNATTKMSPHEVLLGYAPAAAKAITPEMNNTAAEDRQVILKEHRTAAVQALNKTAQSAPPAQYNINKQVWLEAKHLTLPYQTAKLTPKHHGPFRIIKQVSPVAYKLKLPSAWTIHPVFHASLLTPYHKTMEHGTNYQCPPPEMIDDQEEYKVEQVINHQYYGHKRALQYLIQWKGYSAADDTWELADQVFVDTLMKAYHKKHPLKGGEAPSFTTHLCVALAKSHWHPHNPLTNFGVIGPATKQGCTGAWKISAPMVPTASHTMRNTSTLTPWPATQPIEITAEVDTSERNASRRSIHQALIKFFSCLSIHNQPHSPTAPTKGPKTVAQCSTPSNTSKLLATMTPTSTHGWSAFMEGNALLSPKTFPTSIPVNAALWKPTIIPTPIFGHSPWPWRMLRTMPSRWRRPLLPSSVMVQLPPKQEGDVTAQLACMSENHGGMHGDPMMGSGGLLEGRLGEVGPRMEAGEPLEGRSSSNKEVSMSHGCSEQDSDYLACWPILAQSMWCRRRVPAWKVAQWSLATSVSLTIVQWLMVGQSDE